MTRSDTACIGGRIEWNQAQSCGLSLFFPNHATMIWSPKAYEMRSAATAGAVIQYDYLAGKLDMDEARAAVKEVKENDRYWLGDFHPLTRCTIAQDEWLAFQFHLPESNEGMVLGFRRPKCATRRLRSCRAALIRPGSMTCSSSTNNGS